MPTRLGRLLVAGWFVAAAADPVLAAADRSLNVTSRVLGRLDWAAIAAYAAGMIAVGVYYSRRQRSTEQYLLGGRRMRPSSIGLSLFSTLMSTITYLAMPGEMIRYGPVALCYLLVLPVIYPIVGYLLIPRFMKLPVTSAYELLEGRLGLSARLLAAIIFLATRLVWMALIIYLTAKMLAVMLGWEQSTVIWISIVMGLVTLLYTWMGGLQAVVLTDVIQSYLLFGGAVLSVVLITLKMGGVGEWWPRSWQPHWPPATWFSVEPGVRTSIIGSVIWMFSWWICTAGSDQMAIQRYLATRDARTARRAFLITLIANLLTNLTLGVLGFALLGFFKAHPELLSGGLGLTIRADDIFPYYIVHFLPAGAAGLVVAAVLAAAMSSLSSGINSSTSVIKRDFIDRFRRTPEPACLPVAAVVAAGEEGACFKRAQNSATPAASTLPVPPAEGVGQVRTLSLIIGTLIVLSSTLMKWVPGNIVEVTTRTNHLFIAPLFGLFVMAMFVPFATPFGTLFGAAYGLFAAVLVGYWDLLTGHPTISFQYISLISLAVNLTIGIPLSALGPRRGGPARVTRGGTARTTSGGSARMIWTLACAAPMVAATLALALWRAGLLPH